MAKDLAIVLNNGSLASAVATALAAQRYRPILLHATIPGASTARQRAAYDLQVAHYKPYREHTFPLDFLATLQPSTPQPPGASDPRVGAPLGPRLVELLPLVALAARLAAHYQVPAIYLGLRVGTQPDDLAHATEFGQIWNELIQMPCEQAEIELVMPLLELEPWQVVDVGMQVSAPFDRTWSCLAEGSEPCWACRGCRAREAAFQQAGRPDPLRAVRKA